jgi:hypothetical protein
MDGKALKADGMGANGSIIETRLNAISEAVPHFEIAELWLFPPLADVDKSAEFFLFTRFLDGDSRALYSARMVPANGAPSHQVIVEHGRVPAARVPRLIGQLQRRLGRSAPPRHVVIDRDHQRWEDLLNEARATIERNGDAPGPT